MDSGRECKPRMDAPCSRAAAPRDASVSASPPAIAIDAAPAPAPACWPLHRRLRRRAEFQLVYAHGLRRGSEHFLAFARPRADAAPARFGITVTRKAGSAVVRNRLRRRIRELLRRLAGGVDAGWDLVIHPRAGLAQARCSRLELELARLLERATRPESVS